MNAVRLLDRFYAGQLGCHTEDFHNGSLAVTACPSLGGVRFAKGSPLAVFSIARDSGAVLSVLPPLKKAAADAIAGKSCLDDEACRLIKGALAPMLDVKMWFRGCRLYCTGETFIDLSTESEIDITSADETTRCSADRWGGPVFGQLLDGEVASAAVVKVVSDIVWDIGVGTNERFRGRGLAKRSVSAAVRHVLAHGKIATWGCDRDNHASLAVAKAVGFQPYGLDFGCVLHSPWGTDTPTTDLVRRVAGDVELPG